VFMSYAMPNSIKTTMSMIGTPINHKRIGICYPFRYGSGTQRIDTEAVPNAIITHVLRLRPQAGACLRPRNSNLYAASRD